MKNYESRLARVREIMRRREIDCLLVNRTQSVKYLTGADNVCSFLVIHQDGMLVALVLESDYEEYSRQSIVEDIRAFRTHDPFGLWRALIDEFNLQPESMAFEHEHLKYFQYQMIDEVYGALLNRSFSADYILEEARIVKTPDEIEKIKRAAELANFGMQVAREKMDSGMSEIELARVIRGEMLAKGASHSTYLYLASGGRSSLAHNPPKSNLIGKGPVVIDIHAAYDGYHADVARTLFLKEASRAQVDAYRHFRQKVCAAIDGITDGTKLLDLRKEFARSLDLAGDLKILTGPLVHGTGVINSELPRFEYPYHKTGFPETIREDMVLAMTNLGIYSLKGWGIRYEDTFIVTKGKPILLSCQDEA
jgi:Xaa-Pro dipeptidase